MSLIRHLVTQWLNCTTALDLVIRHMPLLGSALRTLSLASSEIASGVVTSVGGLKSVSSVGGKDSMAGKGVADRGPSHCVTLRLEPESRSASWAGGPTDMNSLLFSVFQAVENLLYIYIHTLIMYKKIYSSNQRRIVMSFSMAADAMIFL